MIVTLDLPAAPWGDSKPGYFKALPQTIGSSDEVVEIVNEGRAPLDVVQILAFQLQSAAFALNAREPAGKC